MASGRRQGKFFNNALLLAVICCCCATLSTPFPFHLRDPVTNQTTSSGNQWNFPETSDGYETVSPVTSELPWNLTSVTSVYERDSPGESEGNASDSPDISGLTWDSPLTSGYSRDYPETSDGYEWVSSAATSALAEESLATTTTTYSKTSSVFSVGSTEGPFSTLPSPGPFSLEFQITEKTPYPVLIPNYSVPPEPSIVTARIITKDETHISCGSCGYCEIKWTDFTCEDCAKEKSCTYEEPV